MDIGILKTDLLSGMTEELLQAMRDQKALAADQSVADATNASLVNSSSVMAQSLASGGGNMMDNLFVHASTEESRYVSGMKTSLAVDMQIQLSQSATLLSQFGGINPSGTFYSNPLAMSEREIENKLKRDSNKEIIEKAEEDLDKTVEDMEQRADEAVSSAGEGNTEESDAADINQESDNIPSTQADAGTVVEESSSSTEIIAAEAEAAAAKKQTNGIETATEAASRNAPLAAQAQIYSTQQNALTGVSNALNRVNTMV